MTNIEEIAAEIYTAYRDACGGVSFIGTPMPSWVELRENQKKAAQRKIWIDAARAAVDFSLRQQIDGVAICDHCGREECDCSDADISVEMGSKG